MTVVFVLGSRPTDLVKDLGNFLGCTTFQLQKEIGSEQVILSEHVIFSIFCDRLSKVRDNLTILENFPSNLQ